MKEVVPAMDIITTLSAQEIIRQKKYHMRFLDRLVFKEYVDNKLLINVINFSMLESQSTSNDYNMENDVAKSIV